MRVRKLIGGYSVSFAINYMAWLAGIHEEKSGSANSPLFKYFEVSAKVGPFF